MYRALSLVNTGNQVNPTNRITPVTNWQNPASQIPQNPAARSTASSRGGNPNSSIGPQTR